MMRQIQVGLIGFGDAARLMHVPFILENPAYSLRAVATRQANAVLPAGVRRHDRVEDLLASSDIDLVVIVTPNATHGALVRAALLAGKHVLVEKPFTLALAEAVDLLALARRQQRQLTVFQNRRFDSDFLTVRAALEADHLGRIRHFETRLERFVTAVPAGWRHPAVAGAGAWMDLAPHLIDQVVQLFGPPHSVTAQFAALREGAQAEDWAQALLAYPDKQVIVHCSLLAPGGGRRFIIHGDRATLVKHAADPQGRQLREGMLPGAPGWGIDNDDAQLFDGNGDAGAFCAVAGDHRRFYRELADALRGQGPNPTSAADIVAVMAVLEAGKESAHLGQSRRVQASADWQEPG